MKVGFDSSFGLADLGVAIGGSYYRKDTQL